MKTRKSNWALNFKNNSPRFKCIIIVFEALVILFKRTIKNLIGVLAMKS